MRLTHTAWVYTCSVLLAATGLLGYWARADHDPPQTPLGLLAMLLVLAVAAQQFPLMLAPHYQVNVATAVYLTALLLVAPRDAMILTALSQLCGGGILVLRRNPANGRRRRGLHGILFNTGQLTLATGLACLAYYALLPGSPPAPLDRIENLWALPASAAVLHLVSSGLVAAMVAVQRRQPLGTVWQSNWQNEAFEAVGLSIFGLIMALLATHYPWAPLLLVLPAAILHQLAQRTAQFLAARQVAEQQLRHQATHDPLTGLDNRVAFLERLEASLATGDAPGMLFLDLDGFKVVNDSLGHRHGDELLVAVAERLRGTVGQDGASIARLGGDEFVILLEHLPDATTATAVAEHLLCSLAAPFSIGGRDLVIGASIGITIAGDGDKRALDLLRQADIAMYRAKGAGRGGYAIFDATMSRQADERLALEADLRRALVRGEFELHYQPTITLETGQISGVEALVRWRHPEQGLIPPFRFIPLAEETGLILPLGSWVLAEACRQAVVWHAQFPDRPPITVAVNLSARQLRDPGLADEIARVMRASGIAPRYLTLELTESMLMHDAPATLAVLSQLKSLGVRLAIDDFGTGYSSLAYLKRFPIDILKVDKAFVDGLGRDEQDTAIVRTVLLLGSALDLATTAEGIETAAQAAQLRALGCEMGQGYHFARPALPAAIEPLLATPVPLAV